PPLGVTAVALVGTGTGVNAPNVVASTVTDGQGSTIETVSFGGTQNGTVRFSYNGVPAPDAGVPFASITPNFLPTAVQLQNHLNTIGALTNNVTVIGPNGGAFQVIFNGALTGTIASTLTMVGSGGSFASITSPTPTFASILSNTAPVLGQSEVQTLSFVGVSATSGVFFLTLNGQTTAAIAYDTNNASLVKNVQDALDNMLGAGNTRVGLSPTGSSTAPVLTVTFTGLLAAANLPQFGTVNPNGGGTLTAATAVD